MYPTLDMVLHYEWLQVDWRTIKKYLQPDKERLRIFCGINENDTKFNSMKLHEAFEFLKPQLEKKYQVVDLFKSVHNLLVVDIVDAPALVEVIEFNPQEGYIIMRDIE